jgi:hydrogenase-4 component B
VRSSRCANGLLLTGALRIRPTCSVSASIVGCVNDLTLPARSWPSSIGGNASRSGPKGARASERLVLAEAEWRRAMSVLLLAGCALIAVGGVVALRSGMTTIALDVQLAGVVVLGVGAVGVFADGDRVGAAFHSTLVPAFGLDRLSAFFVLVVSVAALPALLHARDALHAAPHARPLAVLTALFVLALVGVLAARDVSTFLIGWELMTLVPASAILIAHRERLVRRTVFVYLAISHIGGAGVWIALLLLAQANAVGGTMPSHGLRALIAAAALIGFGTKAGLMPLHAWLPRAHPVAPAHISALMSGVMLKVAIYGLIRVLFEWNGPAQLWVGVTLLALGLLSAVGGVTYALVQRELKRLLAFSSIENVGIVALGLGASLVLASRGATMWGAVAFAAALLHTLNHAIFKALLFLSAGAFSRAVGTLELDQLGGLLRGMPWTGWSFLVGCSAIAGLPPLNGFASEWLTLQSLLHLGYQSAAGISVAGAIAVAGLAATAALAVFCFVKVIGLVLLGAARSEPAAEAAEQPRSTRLALALLAGLCVLGGLMPGALVPTLVELAPGDVRLPGGVGLHLPSTGALPGIGIAVALAVVVLVLRLAARGERAATAPAWACGQRVEPALAWTSAGFTKPLRLMLESVFRPQREITVRERDGIVREITYRAEVPHLFDTLLYGPVQRAALHGAAFVRRLQSGSLRAYIVYLLVVLIGLLALVRLGALR